VRSVCNSFRLTQRRCFGCCWNVVASTATAATKDPKWCASVLRADCYQRGGACTRQSRARARSRSLVSKVGIGVC
jgi:hypothetical protein